MKWYANLQQIRYRPHLRTIFTILLILLITTLAGCQRGNGEPALVTTPASAPTSATTSEQADVVPTPTPSPEPETQLEATDTEASNSEEAPAEETESEETGSQQAVDEMAAEEDVEAPVFDPESVTIQLAEVTAGLDRPVFVTHAGDGSGRLFIVEKTGAIRIWANGQLLATPFLDIADRVNSLGNEQGLLGLAFAPDYTTSGFFFVNYSDSNGDTVIARFQVSADDPNQADVASEFVILHLTQPARNHNGGMLLFGPDGAFYIGMGDGGASGDIFGNGQNPSTLLGAMLRIDVTSDPSIPYQIPADNPWINATWNGSDVRDEIWAIGLRNPWRYSFDRATGDLWIGDVGQNAYEEIDLTRAEEFPEAGGGGLNYGWPIMEGQHCYSPRTNCDTTGLVLPLVEYGHQGHCSVTGGYVYRGQQYPVLDGVYFYGDYCSGVLWALSPDGNDGWINTEVLQTGGTLSSFGEDEAGEVYLVDYSGVLYQITAQ